MTGNSNMAIAAKKHIAVWAITPKGAKLAKKLTDKLPRTTLLLSTRTESDVEPDETFESLADAVALIFDRFDAHIFIMSTGIVVRIIAPCLKHKTADPAVVVVDETARFAISLTSGHLGGANKLAHDVATACGATPVITTATDVNDLPAIDLMAQTSGLEIENPAAIKTVNMSILTGKRVALFDPYGFVTATGGKIKWKRLDAPTGFEKMTAEVYIDDVKTTLPDSTLVLRPPTLAVGIGCNRGTDVDEIEALLVDVFEQNNLALNSIKTIGSIDLKKDEQGLLALAKKYKLKLKFYTHQQLDQVEGIKTPSAMVEKHTGAKSVCEAAALLAAGKSRLIVTKKKTPNVTVAVARADFTS
jgi:cobalt-precorrin 5A hydrolase